MIYKGRREGQKVTILAGSDKLPIRTDILPLSRVMGWGDTSDDSTQLALALLAHATESETLAMTYHASFMRGVVSRLPIEGWTLSSQEIEAWLRATRKGESGS